MASRSSPGFIGICAFATLWIVLSPSAIASSSSEKSGSANELERQRDAGAFTICCLVFYPFGKLKSQNKDDKAPEAPYGSTSCPSACTAVGKQTKAPESKHPQ